jgi:hypothetical protein
MNSNPPCPLLPEIDRPLRAADSRALGDQRGEPFYRLCLAYAQTKWIAGLPAQTLLQLNRAMSADLDGSEAILADYPIPYAQMAWVLRARPDRRGQFLGNPRRHWQHYATRMSGDRAELRSWRAWACHAIAVSILPEDDFPDDTEQIAAEGLVIPGLEEIGAQLDRLGLPGEKALWAACLSP